MMRSERIIVLDWPLIAALVGFTAIPLSLEPPNAEALAGFWSVGFASDVIANILGFIPVGVVLAWRGPVRAIGIAAALSGLAESTQFFSADRSPAFFDFATNVLGAGLGVLCAQIWGGRKVTFRITQRRALAGAAVALLIAASGVLIGPRALQRTLDQLLDAPATTLRLIPANQRGLDARGRLEAHWSFDEGEGALEGVNAPGLAEGISGRALFLNGSNYVIASSAEDLQLAGDMTIAAWIRLDAFSDEDATILSTMSHLERGYNFYVTEEPGFQALAVELGANNGLTAARFGRSEIALDRWTFVAATYSAETLDLHLFVDGQEDDACLLGVTPARQTVSGLDARLGRHPENDMEYFHGAMDEVRVYSSALSAFEIAELYAAERPAMESEPLRMNAETSCPPAPAKDPTIMGWLVVVGQLAAVVWLGLSGQGWVRGAVLAGVAVFVGLRWIVYGPLSAYPVLVVLLILAGMLSVLAARVREV